MKTWYSMNILKQVLSDYFQKDCKLLRYEINIDVCEERGSSIPQIFLLKKTLIMSECGLVDIWNLLEGGNDK